jgi:hypothetical protein
MRKQATHRLRLSAAAPAWALRLCACIVLACAVVAFVPDPAWWVAPLAAGAVWAVVPQSLAVWLALVAVPVGMLMAEPDPLRTAAAVLAVHAVHVLAALSSSVPAGARVALSALRPSGLRFLAVQAAAQPLGIAATLLPSSAGGVVVPWLAVAGTAAVLTVALLLGALARPRGLTRRGG